MVDRRKQNKKKSTHRLLGMPAYNKCLKFQGKIVIPTLDGAPGSIRFLDKRHYLLQRAGHYQKSFTSIFQCRTSTIK